MKIPPIDLSKLILLFKAEGKTELLAAKAQPKFLEVTSKGPKPASSFLSNFGLIQEWDKIIYVLEKEITPLLKKGCDAKALLAPAQKLSKSALSISLMASQVLGFVPGPVGIICSVINAIVCFSTGNIVGGLFELLGCIPGGKVAGKASSKLFPKIEKILIEIAESNHALRVIVETSKKQQRLVIEFFEKHPPKTKSMSNPKVGKSPTPAQPSQLEQSLSQKFPSPAIEAQRQYGTYRTFPDTYGNLPKTSLWPHIK